ncbi:CG32655 [Drosophila busckii]|uniref:CG32655 n=1 Tax=Drosophila busckii TaxID=30019 RepID=A0A0M5J867_DROBS|nr:uncharacterized protein LOC108606240 [Drosophila busckii]ALC49131.1 CG32655 [Drosophila busckii]
MSDNEEQQAAAQCSGSTGSLRRVPSANANVFRSLFETLEAEHLKLQALEERRLKLTEEMKNLRHMLQLENQKLRKSVQRTTEQSSTQQHVTEFNRQELTTLLNDTDNRPIELEAAEPSLEHFVEIVEIADSNEAMRTSTPIPLELKSLAESYKTVASEGSAQDEAATAQKN